VQDAHAPLGGVGLEDVGERVVRAERLVVSRRVPSRDRGGVSPGVDSSFQGNVWAIGCRLLVPASPSVRCSVAPTSIWSENAGVDRHFAAVEGRLTKIEAEFGVFRAEISGELRILEARLVRWMFLFWAGTALAGLLLK
jgi:hypothetical protein